MPHPINAARAPGAAISKVSSHSGPSNPMNQIASNAQPPPLRIANQPSKYNTALSTFLKGVNP